MKLHIGRVCLGQKYLQSIKVSHIVTAHMKDSYENREFILIFQK